MAKAATVQARVDIGIKKQADVILKKIGITSSQIINALYAQIVMHRGVPFDLKIPNEETLNAIKELEMGGGKKFSNFKAMMANIDKK